MKYWTKWVKINWIIYVSCAGLANTWSLCGNNYAKQLFSIVRLVPVLCVSFRKHLGLHGPISHGMFPFASYLLFFCKL